MDTLFVAGIDSVAGSHLACTLTDSHVIAGIALDKSVTVDGVEYAPDSTTPHRLITRCHATRVAYCGPASRTSWMADYAVTEREEAKRVRTWARAADAAGVPFTYLSTDALFRGPWLYHEEDSIGRATNSLSRACEVLEEEVLLAAPDSLIVRANCFGWSPDGDQLVESVLEQLRDGARSFPHLHHASILHAGELANLLGQVWKQHATGVLHVGGSERMNQEQFARELGRTFNVPMAPPSRRVQELNSPAVESSFRCTRLKSLVDQPLPSPRDAMVRLREEQQNGFRSRLTMPPQIASRVA